MSFKSITSAQHEAFVSSLAAGQYNLLLGAGASMDSHNRHGPLPSGETLKDELCIKVGASKKHSLQRVFSLLKTDKQIDENITQRFNQCIPGKTPLEIKRFLWKRIFTWNIDDVIENAYALTDSKQKIVPIHFDDDFVEAQSIAELILIHLHGTVLGPDKGYVFSREHYVKQAQTINPWMSVLSTFMRSEPMIISGTALDEPDLDHYLSFRTNATVRDDRGPSIFVTTENDGVTADLCEKHNLLHFVGWTLDFMQYCSKALPHPPTPEELIPQESRKILPANLSRAAAMAFHTDFDLVPSAAPLSENSRFQYGHAPTWSDLASELDVSRPVVPKLIVQIENMLKDTKSPAKLIILSETAGTGKTTILRRVAFDLAKRGTRTLFCSALSRIDRTTASTLDMIDDPIVVVVDNFADQVTAISETMAQLERKDIVIIASERSYRLGYLKTVLAATPYTLFDKISLSEIDVTRLFDKYFSQGNLGDHKILKDPKTFAKQLSKDPIAVACCRILKDFKPLERIVDDIIRESSKSELDNYLCVALSQHCFTGGVKYEILLSATGGQGIENQMDRNHPLPVTYFDNRRMYVIPENASLGERVVARIANDEKQRLLAIFVALALELRPFVNRLAIRRRTPEARLAGRLFDYDDIVGKFLGDDADTFYERTKHQWAWNSRYWEQVSLLNLAKYQRDPSAPKAISYLETSVQRARQAVAIEYHPFGLTTLGKVLMHQMMEPRYSLPEVYGEAFDFLAEAIQREAQWVRRGIQPFTSLFRGSANYIEKGGKLNDAQRDTLRTQLNTAERRFSRDHEFIELISQVRKLSKIT